MITVITDGAGIPLAILLTGGNRHDITQLLELVNAIRWVVEQTVALLHWFRRLRIRWEIRNDVHEAFMRIACSIICYRGLTT